MTPSTRVLAGIAFALAAVACFATLDTTTKFVSASVPVLMALWFRYAFQSAVTTLVVLPRMGRRVLRTEHPGYHILRGLLLFLCSLFAFFSLQFMPVGEFTAVLMITPLVITLLAATTLGEHVSSLRWTLVAGGFAGTLIILRPGGASFGWTLLLPLGLVASNAWFQVLTSRLSGDENPYTTQFYTGLVGALVMCPIVLLSWNTQALLDHWPWFVTLGFLGTFGHLMLIRAFNRASAVVLSPYLYSQIAFATLAGWLAFDHIPDALAWAGIAVIALSGIGNAVLSIREDRQQRQ